MLIKWMGDPFFNMWTFKRLVMTLCVPWDRSNIILHFYLIHMIPNRGSSQHLKVCQTCIVADPDKTENSVNNALTVLGFANF